ncbi:MAG: O-antigen ligase family protein [Microbacteriaceae bacterium]
MTRMLRAPGTRLRAVIGVRAAIGARPSLGVRLPRTPDGRVDRLGALVSASRLAAVAALLLGAVALERSDAGLGGWSIVLGLATTVPLYLVQRGWRLSPAVHLVLAAMPASVLIAGAIDAPDGIGFARAARYAYFGAALLAAASYARTPHRRVVLAGGAALVVLDQYTVGWFAWWGSLDPTTKMLGTFYWHNQFGAFCAAGVAIGVFLAAFGTRVVVLLGAVVAVVASAGALASGSRAALVMTVAAYAVTFIAALAGRRIRAAGRVAGLCALALATAVLLSGSLFFPGSGAWPWQALVARSADGSFVASSGGTRLEFWRAALAMGVEHPLTGVGLSRYGTASFCYDLTLYASNPHNEWLLAWAETGALGVVPLLAVLGGAGWALSVSLRRGGAGVAADPGRWGALVAALLLLAHAGMDFDWAWGSLPGLAGLAGGVALAPLLRRRAAPPIGRGCGWRWRRVAAIVLLAVLLLSGVVGRAADPRAADPLYAGASWFGQQCSE